MDVKKKRAKQQIQSAKTTLMISLFCAAGLPFVTDEPSIFLVLIQIAFAVNSIYKIQNAKKVLKILKKLKSIKFIFLEKKLIFSYNKGDIENS